MRICDCCGGLIEGGARKLPVHSGSGAAPDVYVHPFPCQPSPPRQTYPARTGQ
ncbi:hypothetical protein [Streptomyces sp. NPDC005549]|uniref:hypothetical protein n=1 Tax=Streptomyces sp. NPDC005549 TaxID=3154888 RepID=UPI0033B001EF